MVRAAATVAIAATVFGWSWLFRFNDPGGSYAGLTDDHLFYVVRGWQILFGDLPVRDFADHGAPLHFYVAWAVQVLFGRGTLSELTFSVSAVSLGAALTFWLATRASGSIVLGLVAAAFQVLLAPRFYNYPKILVYATAIPCLWWFADKPDARRRFLLSLVTVIALLFRHDHGVYVAFATAVLLLLLPALSARERARHFVRYALVASLLLAPYLVFLQANGGVIRYFREAAAWAERDRERASVQWPSPFANPATDTTPILGSRAWAEAAATVRANDVAWIYYAEIALPLIALVMLLVSRDAFRPSWPRAPAKVATVAALGAALDAGFLRSPLDARLADPSVPHAILLAWLMAALLRLLLSSASLRPSLRRRAWAIRLAAASPVLPLCFVMAYAVGRDATRRLQKASLTEGPTLAFERTGIVADQVRLEWERIAADPHRDRLTLNDLSRYLNACTLPTDRVFIDAYLPQVVALARRAFAGGHADLRAGMFDTPAAQQLTVARLQRQSVPVVLLDASDAFHADFPLVASYFDRHYRFVEMQTFSGRFPLKLYVTRERQPTGRYEAFGWPCYASGRVGS